MKKVLFSLVMVASFAIGSLNIQSSLAQSHDFTHAPPEDGGGTNEIIKCYCKAVFLNGQYVDVCKAGSSGTLCAQSPAGGNVQCSKYDGNC